MIAECVKIAIHLLSIFVILLCVSCSQGSKTPSIKHSDLVYTSEPRSTTEAEEFDSLIQHNLEWLENANPEADANQAIKNEQIYFMGAMGYAMEVPGVDDYYDKYVDSAGSKVTVKIIGGTSDAASSDNQERLDIIARKYATRFNKIILNHLNQRKTTVPDKQNDDAGGGNQ